MIKVTEINWTEPWDTSSKICYACDGARGKMYKLEGEGDESRNDFIKAICLNFGEHYAIEYIRVFFGAGIPTEKVVTKWTTETAWDYLVDLVGISKETLDIITTINGYTLDTLEDVLYATTGYDDFAQHYEEYVLTD